MKLTMIGAMSRNRVIGADGQLPWDIPEDLQWFKAITLSHPVIMGKYTFLSLGKPLPHRTNIILTTDADFTAPGCLVYRSLEEAIQKLEEAGTEEAFVIGGESVYTQALHYADQIYLTIVQRHLLGDTYFPEIPKVFEKVSVKLKDTYPQTNFEVWQRNPYAPKKEIEAE